MSPKEIRLKNILILIKEKHDITISDMALECLKKLRCVDENYKSRYY
jgi:hypothetical protein